jgi:hypothetical protein
MSRKRRYRKALRVWSWKPPSITPPLLADAKMDNQKLEELRVSCAHGKYTFDVSSPLIRPIYIAEQQFRLVCTYCETTTVGNLVDATCLITYGGCELFGKTYRTKKPKYCKGDFIKFPSYFGWALINPTINGKEYPYAFLNTHSKLELPPPRLKQTEYTGKLVDVYERIKRCHHSRGELARGIPKPGNQVLQTVLRQVPYVKAYLIGYKTPEGKPVTYPHVIEGVVESYREKEIGMIDAYIRSGEYTFIVPFNSTVIVIVEKLMKPDKLRQLTLKLLSIGHVVEVVPNANYIRDFCRDLGEEYYRRHYQDVQHVNLEPPYLKPYDAESEHDIQTRKLVEDFLR